MIEHRFAAVHEYARAQEGFVVRFAHVGAEGADEIEMLPRVQPGAADQGLARHGGGAHDIGAAHGPFEIMHHLHAGIFAR